MATVHKIVYTILRPLVYLFLKIKFGYRMKKPGQLPENYIVLANHATNFDPLLVAVAFPQMYFVGSEHISRWGFASRLLKFFLAPILRPKGAVASHTVKEILQTLRGGHNVCLFAEGTCTWDGDPSPILPSTGKMLQKARCGLVTYRLMGGFFAQPRWGTSGTRRGWLRGEPVNIYTAEQIAAMTTEEVNEIIRRDLAEHAYDRQLASPKRYKSKRTAEGLEYLLYRCPACGEVVSFHTQGNTVSCPHCGAGFRYNEYGMLEGTAFSTLLDFSRWQQEETSKAASLGQGYASSHGKLISVANSVAVPVDEGPVSLTPEALTCGNTAFPLQDITSLDIHSKQAVVFTAGKTYFELVPEGNALKFVHLYQSYVSTEQKTAQVQ